MLWQVNVIAFYTLLRKEIRRFMRIWVQTLIPPAITMMLYFVIFGNLVGKRIGQMGGFDYIQYIVPGLIMMSVITNSYANVCSSFFSSKFQRSIEELLVAPIANPMIILGFVAGGVTRGVLVGLIVTGLSLFFSELQLANVGITLLVLILTSVLFSLGGLVNAVFAKKFDDITVVPTFVLTPLTYFGGVFYSISLLSDFWQVVTLINPIVYMVNAFRYGVLGVSDVSFGLSITMIVILIIMLWIWAHYLLAKGIGLRS